MIVDCVMDYDIASRPTLVLNPSFGQEVKIGKYQLAAARRTLYRESGMVD